jgi:hypothetical protein
MNPVLDDLCARECINIDMPDPLGRWQRLELIREGVCTQIDECPDIMHIAPELFKARGLENVPFAATFEADMYAFGCILFQLIFRETILPKHDQNKKR